MSEMVALYGFGGGGTGAALTVTAPTGVTVTVSKDGKTKTKVADASGVAVFKGLASGTWTVTITGDGKTAQKSVMITADYRTAISFSTIPEFTYTGDFEIVNDSDEPIIVSQDNWKIRFLTSGTLTLGTEVLVDVFAVGGSSSSHGSSSGFKKYGNGGQYAVSKSISLKAGSAYTVVIGSGGAAGGRYAGGSTTAFGLTADGGAKPVDSVYGNPGGRIKEFNESANPGIHEYSGAVDADVYGSAPENTGTAGSSKATPYQGSAGIVIIRNTREVA